MLTRITLGHSQKLLCFKAMSVEKVNLLLRTVLYKLPQYAEFCPRHNSGKKRYSLSVQGLFQMKITPIQSIPFGKMNPKMYFWIVQKLFYNATHSVVVHYHTECNMEQKIELLCINENVFPLELLGTISEAFILLRDVSRQFKVLLPFKKPKPLQSMMLASKNLKPVSTGLVCFLAADTGC